MTYTNQKNNNPVENSSDGAEISFKDIAQVVVRRKWGVISIILLSILGSILLYLNEKPVYLAKAVIMINKPQQSNDIVDAVLGFDPNSDSQYAIKDVELLKSIPVSEKTVMTLWNSDKASTLELFDNRPYISPVQKIFSWLIPETKGKKKQNYTPGTPLYEQTMRLYAQRFNSRIKINSLRGTSIIEISVVSPFKDESVYLTNTLCEVYKKMDIDRNSERYIQANRFVADMIRDQEKLVEKADADLSQYMSSNNIYEITGNTGALLGKLLDYDTHYEELMAEYRITLNNRNFVQNQLSEGERDISNKISRTIDTQLASINDDLRAKESEYINLLISKNQNDAEVKEKRNELEQLRTRYEQMSKNKIAGQISYIGQSQKYRYEMISEKLLLDRKLNNLNFSANEYKKIKEIYEKRLDSLPGKEQNFVRLQRDRDVVSKTYLFLKEKQDETRILIGSEVGNISIIGSAFEPFSPESPDYKKNLVLGMVLGLVLSAVYAFVAERLDDRINYDPYFFKSLGFSIWGIVPLIPSFKVTTESGIIVQIWNRITRLVSNSSVTNKKKEITSSQVSTSQSENETISCPMMTEKLNSSFAESFRSLRTNLAFARIDQPIKTLLISGCSIGEGKSTVSANLAMGWALADKKTLIIDADLRRPSQHRIFKKSRALGLADCLVNNDLEINDRYIHKTHIDNLFLISAGSPVPNPNELLGSDRMKVLLTNLSEKFERIIIDSPPVFISDAAQLLSMVDGVLISVRLGYSSKFTLKQYAYDSFIHSHIVGVVLIDNERPTKGISGQGYSRYGYSYGEYGNSYSENKDK